MAAMPILTANQDSNRQMARATINDAFCVESCSTRTSVHDTGSEEHHEQSKAGCLSNHDAKMQPMQSAALENPATVASKSMPRMSSKTAATRMILAGRVDNTWRSARI